MNEEQLEKKLDRIVEILQSHEATLTVLQRKIHELVSEPGLSKEQVLEVLDEAMVHVREEVKEKYKALFYFE